MRILSRALACCTIALVLGGCGSTPSEETAACEAGADCASGFCVAGVCSEDFTSVSERDAVTVQDAGLLEPGDAGSDTASEDAGSDTASEDAGPDTASEDAGSDTASEDAAPDTTPEDVVDEDVLADTSGDTVMPDADVDVASDIVEPPDVDADAESDAIGEDTETDTPDPRNECGGFTELLAAPGAPCGPCERDEWVCDGTEMVVCSGATVANACGGCEDVELAPGSSCGVCGGGVLVCETPNATNCVLFDEEVNACGGCEALAGVPGEACGVCGSGRWACADDGGVRCVGDGGDGAQNACGGCSPLDETPGASCGVCDGGIWACVGANRIACDELTPPELNACGGCAPLDEPIGERCGVCDSGEWACRGVDDAICEGDAGDLATNLCGGCGELDEIPGTECGACGELWQCDGDGGVVCIAGPRNACGGCTELDDEPGDSCFRPSCGFVARPVFVCDGAEALECVCDAPPVGCGDGVWDQEAEECDDGNARNNDGCSNLCETETVLDDQATCGDAPALPNNGRVMFDICDTDDDSDNAQTDVCAGSRTGDDVVGRLVITERSSVFVDARDADDGVPVDVVVYLRTSCRQESSQIACGDDAPCALEPDIGTCVGDLQPRVAQFDVELGPGVYFLVVDNYEYDAGGVEFACGDVQLSVFTTPL